ncbi:MAG TPA: ribosomal protein S18-alanine N-acetyltransferase [Acidimicrobiales bacterium]|nr:ribosomal protein S18-alanine N-acetyltransferase [Acidimicrobiales bacterium]
MRSAEVPAAELAFAPMRRRDLRQVMAIEQVVFPEPWSLTVFASELALREGRAYRVAREGRKVVGYFGLMFIDDEAHVTTVAVAPDHQHHGVGTALMLEVARTALATGCRHLSLEVAAGNERAQALYRRFGFAPVGVRKGYYQRTGEDAFVMWAHDVDSPAYAERLAGIEARLRSGP